MSCRLFTKEHGQAQKLIKMKIIQRKYSTKEHGQAILNLIEVYIARNFGKINLYSYFRKNLTRIDKNL